MADQQSWIDPATPVPEQILFDRSRFPERNRAQISRLEPRVAATDLSIIIPTRNEAGNIAQLLRRLEPMVRTRSVEIIFVDDSTDQTPQTIDDASKRMEPEFQSKNEVTDWYLSKRELGK